MFVSYNHSRDIGLSWYDFIPGVIEQKQGVLSDLIAAFYIIEKLWLCWRALNFLHAMCEREIVQKFSLGISFCL